MADNFFLDNDDLRFQLRRLDWDTLVSAVEVDPADKDAFKNGREALESFEQMLESLGEFSAKEVAPHWKELDAQHPELKDGEVQDPPRMKTCMEGLAAMGAMGLTAPRRLGGLNAPMAVEFALMEILGRADTSVMSHFGFHGGIAAALQLYSLEEGSYTAEGGFPVKTRFDDQVRAMASGKEWGSMVLTEPQAGSDLNQIRAAATPQADGTWRITGQKIYITSGHGEHHIVIARSEDAKEAPGLKGLSLFYVPAHRMEGGKRIRNVQLGGVEHKMGQHSAVAATLNFEDSHAQLIGTRRQGFRGMLLLMNNARIAVGFQALGICEAAHRMARSYAENRMTMGKPIAQHEMVAEILDDMDLNIRGLRAVCFDAAYHQEMSERLHVILKLKSPDPSKREEMEKAARRHTRRARHLTPLIKYFAGEEAVRISRMGMQVFGGLGYIRETGAERLLRDALVLPIYEGTSQIQSLMALKDNLQKALRSPARFFQKMANARVQSLSEKDPVEKGLARLEGYSLSAMQTIIARIAAHKVGEMRDVPLLQWRTQLTNNWDPSRDFSFGMLHAERLTQLLVYASIGKTLWEQAQQAHGTPDAEERRDLAERWVQRWEPRARGILGEIESSAGSVLRALRRKPNGAAHAEDRRTDDRRADEKRDAKAG